MREYEYIRDKLFSDDSEDLFRQTSNMNIFNRFLIEVINYSTMFINIFRQIKPDFISRNTKRKFVDFMMLTAPFKITSSPLQLLIQRHDIMEKRVVHFLLDCFDIRENSDYSTPEGQVSFLEHELFFDDNLDLIASTNKKPDVKKHCFDHIQPIDNSELEIIPNIPVIQSSPMLDALFNFQATCFADKVFLQKLRTSNDRHLLLEQIFMDLFPGDPELIKIIIMNPFERNIFLGQRGVIKNGLKHTRLIECLYQFLLHKKEHL